MSCSNYELTFPTLAVVVVPCVHHLDRTSNSMHKKIPMLPILLLSEKDAVMDKVPKQPTTYTGTQSKQSSITIQAMTNDTLLQLRRGHLMSTGTG
jgi:hypothetical protein